VQKTVKAIEPAKEVRSNNKDLAAIASRLGFKIDETGS
jgi:hypothetical protein